MLLNYRKKMLTSLYMREMPSRSTLKYHFHYQLAKIKKFDNDFNEECKIDHD